MNQTYKMIDELHTLVNKDEVLQYIPFAVINKRIKSAFAKLGCSVEQATKAINTFPLEMDGEAERLEG